MFFEDPRALALSRVPLCNTSTVGHLHGLTKPQIYGHRWIPPKAPTAEPPTTSLQIPSPHNHKLTTERQGNWGGKREGWDRRKKSGGSVITEQPWTPWIQNKIGNKCNVVRRNVRLFRSLNLLLLYSKVTNSLSLCLHCTYTPTAAKTEKTERAPESSTILAVQTTKQYANELPNDCHHLGAAN